MIRRCCLLSCLIGWLSLTANLLLAQSLSIAPARETGVYRTGEPIRWTIEWKGVEAPPTAHYVVKRDGLTEVAAGEVAFSENLATVSHTLAQPAAVLLEVTWTENGEAQTARGGAVAAPDRISPTAPPPADFDAFWTRQLEALAAIPLNPRVKSVQSPADGVDRFEITLDNINGSEVHGQLARPHGTTKRPALLIVQWAGVYGLQPEWATDRAREGWLVFNILPHDLPIDQPPSYYEELKKGPLGRYWEIGHESPDTSYFLRMYLSCHRGIEYLKCRPEWDGRTLVVMGTSQGGQQALVTAGLHPDVTAALALVPAGCDTLAPTQGRAAAFPFWQIDNPAVRETSRYFDAAHFAARARCPVLIGAALEDTVCPPATVLAAANQVNGYKEVVLLPRSGHQNVNGSQDPYNRRVDEGWLPALLRGLPAPAALTAEQDHQRLRAELGLPELRPGASPNPAAPNAANTDETKATPYPVLPPALTTTAGTPVRTAEAWRQKRRPELLALFADEIYGHVPRDVPAVNWQVRETRQETIGGLPVVTRRLAGVADNSAYPFLHVAIDLTVSTPADAGEPVPVMLHFGWPESVLSMFPASSGPTWQEQVLARGWAAATIVPTSFQADNGAGLTQGIIGLANHGRPRTPEQWGALRAWAWGASRALDYFETDPAVDAQRVGLEGLSRYGKAVLVAMAFDPRFAVAFVGSSGAGGAKLLRRDFGERVENLAGSGAYHWMAGHFLKYAGPLTWDDLPVDAHQLIALCAPRPVFIGAGSGEVEGHWIDQRGMFLAAAAASPVYELLGATGLRTSAQPPIGENMTEGALAWRQHEGGHTNMPNWPTFLDWAQRQLASPAPEPNR